ncbi:MAG: hypothetical protein LBV17_08330 [Treponema sp.]|nr:hypothetical protein [Treponema sp.]
MKAKICVIISILVIGSVFFSCSTKNGITESGINVKATGTSEGIILHFDNIPKDIGLIWVSLRDFYGIDSNHPIETYAAIEGNELTELRKNQNLVCPFVKNGHDYVISVYFKKDHESESYKWYHTGAIASGGIYLTNFPLLCFNDKKDSVTLSEKPIFSEEVIYSQDSFFDYTAFVVVDKNDALYGGGGRSNELTHDIGFLTNETKEHFGITGDLPVFASVRCILNYGKQEWVVGIANTERSIMSF